MMSVIHLIRPSCRSNPHLCSELSLLPVHGASWRAPSTITYWLLQDAFVIEITLCCNSLSCLRATFTSGLYPRGEWQGSHKMLYHASQGAGRLLNYYTALLCSSKTYSTSSLATWRDALLQFSLIERTWPLSNVSTSFIRAPNCCTVLQINCGLYIHVIHGFASDCRVTPSPSHPLLLAYR